MTSRRFPPPSCWSCGTPVPPERAEVEAVIQTRTAADGGPFLTIDCPRCRTRCGALRNRSGAWLLYPLEGGEEPTLLDRIVPRTSREQLERARRWWLRNAAAVERFRRAAPDEAPRDDGRRRAGPSAADPHAGRRPATAAAAGAAPVTGPRAVLGVAADASLADVRRAWRAAVKRWHPDRIPTTDAVVLEEAQRRFHEIRLAYDALLAELSAGRGRSR